MSVFNQRNLLKCLSYMNDRVIYDRGNYEQSPSLIIEVITIISEQGLHNSLKFLVELGVENVFTGTGCRFDIHCRILSSACIGYNIR